VCSRLREAGVCRDAYRVRSTLALEDVDSVCAVGEVDASRCAADIVFKGAGVAVALQRAQAAPQAAPHTEGTRCVAGLDVAGLGQRLALAAAGAAARERDLLAAFMNSALLATLNEPNSA
jgi:hypothetical protein